MAAMGVWGWGRDTQFFLLRDQRSPCCGSVTPWPTEGRPGSIGAVVFCAERRQHHRFMLCRWDCMACGRPFASGVQRRELHILSTLNEIGFQSVHDLWNQNLCGSVWVPAVGASPGDSCLQWLTPVLIYRL